MVHGTWQVPGEFGIAIFDENTRKHLVLFQEFSNHFGMANAVVSNYMALHECVINSAVVCNQQEAFMNLEHAYIVFLLVMF